MGFKENLEDIPPPVFIGREQELREAISRLQRMASNLSVADCVLFFSGVCGSGKTALLQQIREKAHGWGTAGGSAFIDFSIREYKDEFGKTALTREIMQQIAHTADFVVGTPVIIESATTYDLPKDACEKFYNYVNDVYNFKQRRPFVLIFDHLEDMVDDTVWQWAQQELLIPLLDTHHALIVMSSRISPNMFDTDIKFPLKRRSRTCRLPGLSQQQAQQLINQLGSLQQPETVTCGLPGLIEAQVKQQRLSDNSDNVMRYLVEHGIWSRLGKKAQGLEQELVVIALLPNFYRSQLQQLLHTYWPHKYHNVKELLDKLKQSTLLELCPNGGYTIISELKPILQAYCKEKYPDIYAQLWSGRGSNPQPMA
jgi:hypothetical protein